MIKKQDKLNIEEYIEFLLAEKNLSKNTRDSYLNDLNQFHKFFKDKSLSKITEFDIRKYIGHEKDELTSLNLFLDVIEYLSENLSSKINIFSELLIHTEPRRMMVDAHSHAGMA